MVAIHRRWIALVVGSVVVLFVGSFILYRKGQSTVGLFATSLAIPPPAMATATIEHLQANSTMVMVQTTSVLATTAFVAATPDGSVAETPASLSTTVEGRGTAALAPQPLDSALTAELQRILDEIVADGYVPGAVLAVHVPGQLSWRGASGLAYRQAALSMEPNTTLRIGSVSKMFTAVVVLQLVQEGKLELDVPIGSLLPDLVPNDDIITVRHLLSHRSGLYDYLEDTNFALQAYYEPNRPWTPEQLVGYAAQFAPAFVAGSEGNWDYSSTNYVVLGMLVEHITGHTLAQELRQRIFGPLNLVHTSFLPDETVHGIQAHGYSEDNDVTDSPMSFVFATGSIVSSVDDLQRFVQALFGGQLLQPPLLEQMNRFVNGHSAYNMPTLEYGLGIMRNQLPVGPGLSGRPRPATYSTVVGHIGGYGGFRAALWSVPESGIIITLGVNQSDFDPNALATRVLHTILLQMGQ